MAFTKGNKLAVGKGRPVGSVNKRTLEVEQLCEKHDCNPLEILLMFAKGDWEGLGYDASVYISESDDGTSTKLGYVISPELRVQAAKEACQYLMPKKKSIEQVKPNMLDGMTPQEKLEAMKQAVRMLEGELDATPGEINNAV